MIKRTLIGGVASLVVLVGAYGFENTKCEPVAQGPYKKYDAAVIISGGVVPKPKDLNDIAFTATRTRIREAANLYERGLFDYIVLTGTPEDVELMSGYLDGRNIPYSAAHNGTNTTEDLLAGFEQISEGSSVVTIAGGKQKDRVALISERDNLDPENDDGYIGVESTDMPDLLGLVDWEHAACATTRFRLEGLKDILISR